MGPWPDQGVSTYRAAAAAMEDGRWDDAVGLARYLVTEAEEGHRLFPEFTERCFTFLLERGVAPADVEHERERLLELVRLPDGRVFDIEEGWSSFTSTIDVFGAACRRMRREEALRLLDQAREAWRQTHDRACDLVFGAIDACARLLGEEAVPDVWDVLMADLYPSRDRFDIDVNPWSRSLHELIVDALESLRGHLSGAERMGDVEVIEEPDRFVLRFAPCGSGGRTYQPDVEGGPPRMEDPFGFGVTSAPHDWSWGKAGVCLYCVHCCRLQEQVPIERFGYPVRVVDPPTWPAARAGGAAGVCTWTIYKDPDSVPEEAYRRVGARKPDRLGSGRGRQRHQ
jgi:hypothetical protein